MIHSFDEAVEEFDETMIGVYNTEVERLAREKELQEYMALNAGKPPGYFKVPVFHGKKKSYKAQDLKMNKQWNKSIKIGKPRLAKSQVNQVAQAYVSKQKTLTRN